ncbi:MAG: hypothetical protein QM496_17970 [Verrucomicrobiota bacterium]
MKNFLRINPKPYLIASLLLLLQISATAADAPLHLTLPPALYAVPGVPLNLDFRNTVLADSEDGHIFKVDCELGIVVGKQR